MQERERREDSWSLTCTWVPLTTSAKKNSTTILPPEGPKLTRYCELKDVLYLTFRFSGEFEIPCKGSKVNLLLLDAWQDGPGPNKFGGRGESPSWTRIRFRTKKTNPETERVGSPNL